MIYLLLYRFATSPTFDLRQQMFTCTPSFNLIVGGQTWVVSLVIWTLFYFLWQLNVGYKTQ